MIKEAVAAEITNKVYWALEDFKKDQDRLGELLRERRVILSMEIISKATNPSVAGRNDCVQVTEYYYVSIRLVPLNMVPAVRAVGHIVGTLYFPEDEMFHPRNAKLIKVIETTVDLMLGRLLHRAFEYLAR